MEKPHDYLLFNKAFTNLKGNPFNWSVIDLLGMYNSANEQIIPDLVIPVLKKQLKEQEGS
ncbi:hypothetical protein [Candidatus Symbiopectobacterium sp.]|uniref:hypothetical protein n=1 Tax=unclassified Symbiopectobacterium TaxID=2794573 RepID=UPI0025C59CCE|nr:hypothetical protein [Candidatus Symbiopectobacterium sp.]